MSLKVYLIDLQKIISTNELQLLTPEELAFAEKFRLPRLKQQQLASRFWLRKILGQCLQQSPASLRLAKTAYGKPYLIDYPDINFNLSHSGNLMLLAVSRVGKVGIDIEVAQTPPRDFSGLIKKCFAVEEQLYWQQLPEIIKPMEFYRFWTRKEALVKAIGHGLSVGLQHCVIATEAPLRFKQIPELYGNAENWQLFDLSVDCGYYAALVIEKNSLSENFCLTEIIRF
jgi:4'-phosphopantetheinyl transferase